MLEFYLDFMSEEWRGLGTFKVSSVQSVFRTCELMSNVNKVHNTFFVATLIYNVVQHFLSQLKSDGQEISTTEWQELKNRLPSFFAHK